MITETGSERCQHVANQHTVGELIEILKTFPSELPVLVSGYESGFENFYSPHLAECIHKPDNMYFDGEYQFSGENDQPTQKAVILARILRDD